jgi:Rod binding domain-containing protein
MDSTELMSIQPTLLIPLGRLSGTMLGNKIENLRVDEIDNVSDYQKKKIAKDFESVLINKLLEQAGSTIGDFGFDQDGASQQIQGMFWLYLARDVANKGGFGLWKDLYELMKRYA